MIVAIRPNTTADSALYPTSLNRLTTEIERKALGVVALSEKLSLDTPRERPRTVSLPMAFSGADQFLEAWISNVPGSVQYGVEDVGQLTLTAG